MYAVAEYAVFFAIVLVLAALFFGATVVIMTIDELAGRVSTSLQKALGIAVLYVRAANAKLAQATKNSSDPEP